jgi:hypothetical protein
MAKRIFVVRMECERLISQGNGLAVIQHLWVAEMRLKLYVGCS